MLQVWSRLVFSSSLRSPPSRTSRLDHNTLRGSVPSASGSFKISVLKPQKSGLRVLLPDHSHKRSLAEPDPPHHHESKAFVVTNQSSHFVQTNLIFHTSPVSTSRMRNLLILTKPILCSISPSHPLLNLRSQQCGFL